VDGIDKKIKEVPQDELEVKSQINNRVVRSSD